MMLVLSISMLPQNTVHEWLGCHKDRTTKSIATEDQLQVSQQTLHCSCDQPEFQSPFIVLPELYTTAYLVFTSITNENLQEAVNYTPIQNALLRGPPAVTYLF
jgi:hypothetical protein